MWIADVEHEDLSQNPRAVILILSFTQAHAFCSHGGSGVRYIDKTYRKPIYRQFCKILISIEYCIDKTLAYRIPLHGGVVVLSSS